MPSIADLKARLSLDSDNYDKGLDSAADKAETLGQKIERSLVAAAQALGETLGKTAVLINEGVGAAVISVGGLALAMDKTAGEAGLFARAILGSNAALAEFETGTATAGSALEAFRGAFRSAELGISTYRYGLLAAETVTTAFGIGLAIVAEKTIEAALDTEKLIEAQATLAATTNKSFLSINALAEAEKQLGVDAGSFKILGIDNIEKAIPRLQELAGLAKQFEGMEDPVERADLAFKLFGEDAAKIMPLLNRDLKAAAENAYDLSVQLDKPTRESLYRIRTEFDGFVAFFKSGWRSISLESSNTWHEVELAAIKSLTAIEQGVHGLVTQMNADFAGAGRQLEGILTTLPKLLPSGGETSVQPGLFGASGSASPNAVGAVIPSALDLTNTARLMGQALLDAMVKPKLPAEALSQTFRAVGLSAAELAAIAARLAQAYADVGLTSESSLHKSFQTLVEDQHLLQAEFGKGKISLDDYNIALGRIEAQIEALAPKFVQLDLNQAGYELARAAATLKDFVGFLPSQASADGIKAIVDQFYQLPLASSNAEEFIYSFTSSIDDQSLVIGKADAALKLLHISIDDAGNASNKLVQAFEDVAADGSKSIQTVELAWSAASGAIRRLAQTDLPDAIRAFDDYIARQVQAGASTGRLMQLEQQRLQLIIQEKTLSGESANAEIISLEQLRIRTQALIDATTNLGQVYVGLRRNFDDAFKTLEDGIANNIVDWKNWGDVLENIGDTVAKSLLKTILEGALKPIKNYLDQEGGVFDTLSKTITKGVSAVTGHGFSIPGLGGLNAGSKSGGGLDAAGFPKPANSSVDYGDGSTPTDTSTVPDSSSAPSSGSGLSSLSSITSLASLGVQIASGITQGIQNSRMINLLGEIEISTRQTKEQLTGGIQYSLNTYLPELKHLTDIWGELVSGHLAKIQDVLWWGALNVNVANWPGGSPLGTADFSWSQKQQGDSNAAQNLATGGQTGQGGTPVGGDQGGIDPVTARTLRTNAVKASPLPRLQFPGGIQAPAQASDEYQLKPGEIAGADFTTVAGTSGIYKAIPLNYQQQLEQQARLYGLSPDQLRAIIHAEFVASPKSFPLGEPFTPGSGDKWSTADTDKSAQTLEYYGKVNTALEQYRTGLIDLTTYNKVFSEAQHAYSDAFQALHPIVAAAPSVYQQAQNQIVQGSLDLQRTVNAQQAQFWANTTGKTAQQIADMSTALTASVAAAVAAARVQTPGVFASLQPAGAAGPLSGTFSADQIQGLVGQFAQQLAALQQVRDSQMNVQNLQIAGADYLKSTFGWFQSTFPGRSGAQVSDDEIQKVLDATGSTSLGTTVQDIRTAVNALTPKTQSQALADYISGADRAHQYDTKPFLPTRSYAASPVNPSDLIAQYYTRLSTAGTNFGDAGLRPGESWSNRGNPAPIQVTVNALDQSARAATDSMILALRHLGIPVN